VVGGDARQSFEVALELGIVVGVHHRQEDAGVALAKLIGRLSGFRLSGRRPGIRILRSQNWRLRIMPRWLVGI
ncbi:MAG TPA: hypothetical protein VLK33_01475, partial [Terriglobales bacterium]|nr:hypothetical protein [Terriglobales bacterium]